MRMAVNISYANLVFAVLVPCQARVQSLPFPNSSSVITAYPYFFNALPISIAQCAKTLN
jgi:hypothetical protein